MGDSSCPRRSLHCASCAPRPASGPFTGDRDPSSRSGHEREAAAVGRPHDAEVATVQGGDGVGTQPFGGCGNGGVDRSERQVAISVDELGDAEPVASGNRLDQEITRGDVAEEADLGGGADSGSDEVGHFGDDEGGHDKWTVVAQ
jgi:hypothetical protein